MVAFRGALPVALALLAVLSGCAALSGPATPTQPPGEGTAVLVTRVVDGDTLKVQYRNDTEDTVRLLGVDTPEVHSENTPGEFPGVPDTPAGRQCLRRWGEEASTFATRHLSGTTVVLRADPNLDARDFYGRLLAEVFVAGESFNYRLVDEGYARVYESGFADRERYEAAATAARRAGRGLWQCAEDGGTPGPTAAGTVTPLPDGGSPVAVARVHADAAGDDAANLTDEYVVFASRADAELDLSGWTVTDEAGHRYAFPEGTTLAPGAELTLITGSGTNSGGRYYWGSSRPIWNNAGDTVTLRNDEGAVVVSHSYGR